MKKVLIISHMYPSSANGVLGIFVHKQVQKLIKEGCEVRVVCPVPYVPSFFSLNKKLKNYIDIPKSAVIDGIKVFYPRYIEFPKGMFLQYSGYFMYLGIKKLIRNIYKDFKFDVIHAHTAIPVGFSTMLLKREYKVPFVVTIHGQDFQYTINKNSKCRKNVMRAIESADKVITVSNKLRNVVKDSNVLKKTVVINNGINPEEYMRYINDADDKDIKFDDEYIILSTAALIKTKGIDLNIRAMAEIVKKHPHIKYYIIGDGDESNNLKNLVDNLSLNENVIFLGRLPHDKVIRYMSKCNLFSLPSWQEGFGIVYIEAMMNGIPVIGVEGQGIEDVITDGENGFLVKPQNVKDLVSIIEYILDNREKAEAIGKKGKKDVLNEYTWLRNAQKTIDIYKDITKK